LIDHDALVQVVDAHSNVLNTKSWQVGGGYNSDAPNSRLIEALKDYALEGAN